MRDVTGTFSTAESCRRIERQLHHYGSGLNAIPVLSHYREHPDDDYLLRVGYGGTMGALVKHRSGRLRVGGVSFISVNAEVGSLTPATMVQTSSVTLSIRQPTLINHPEFGWQAFGGNVKVMATG